MGRACPYAPWVFLRNDTMLVIVGIGNPGDTYQDTRHNIGFMVVDRLSREISTPSVVFTASDKLHADIARVGDILLVKPTTYVNKSGLAVSSVLSFYRCTPADLWVIHDDIDLPIGKIRIRDRGASAGHNGIQSIIDTLKTDAFVRFRLGIGRGKESLGRNEDKNLRHRSVIKFVLSRFRQSEAGSFKHLLDHGVDAVRLAMNAGIDKAMNTFN